ncbi:MAG: phosphate ABC transporter permease PstA [Pirellulales bacterium]
MREQHTDSVEYLICPTTMIRRGDGATGSMRAPFATLDQALDNIQQTIVQAGEAPRQQLDLVCAHRPNDAPRGGRPRFQYYVDAVPMGTAGDGSEASPWPDMPTAIAELQRLSRDGALRIAPGEVARLTRREPFTTTSLDGKKRKRERVAKSIFMTMTVLLVVPLVAILVYLVVQAWPALSLELLFANPKNNMTAGGIWSALIGTFFLVMTSLLIAAPIGVLAGVYLNEYAPDNWLTRMVQLAVVNLAGVPSIVHALFGVGAFVLASGMGESVIAAACTLAVMTLPVIITSTREALASVPMAFREACWNMGASRWQTIRTIVLPNSISGILTGVILQVSRAAGETAPIMFTGAVFFVPVPDTGWESWLPYGPFDNCMALSMHLYTLRTQIVGAPLSLQFGTAVVLIGLVLAVNSASIALRVYLRSRKKW